jgi:hypothetical protein
MLKIVVTVNFNKINVKYLSIISVSILWKPWKQMETRNYALNLFVKTAPTKPIREVAMTRIPNRYDTSKKHNWKPNYAQIMLV